MWEDKRICKNEGFCCFRGKDKKCQILRDTHFEDGQCHFRKLIPDEANLYDAMRKSG